MPIELPIEVDEDVAEEIRDDLADGRTVTIQIDAEEAGELPDLIDYQLETEGHATGTSAAYREWKRERDAPEETGRFF